MSDTGQFDTPREREFSELGNWIEDNLDVNHSTASEMADAALDVKYRFEAEPVTDCKWCPGEMYRDGTQVVCDSCGRVKLA